LLLSKKSSEALIVAVDSTGLSLYSGTEWNRIKHKKDKTSLFTGEILRERDDAINYIQHNTINGNQSLARKSWKEKVGYHARSLVETTMWQIKSHCSDRLRNKREDTRDTEAKIKCKIINLILAA
jgi:hypothetical protein